MQINYKSTQLEYLLELHSITPISFVNVSRDDFITIKDEIFAKKLDDGSSSHWVGIKESFSVHSDVWQDDFEELYSC